MYKYTDFYSFIIASQSKDVQGDVAYNTENSAFADFRTAHGSADGNMQADFQNFIASNPAPFWDGRFEFGGASVPKLWVYGGSAGLVLLFLMKR